MVQRILNREPRAFDAVVLSGTAFRTLRFMESGDLNARWKSPGPDGEQPNGFEWLSRDPETARKFIADPLCFAADTAKLLGLPDSLRLLGGPGPDLAADVPILIVSGGEDPLSRGDGLRRLADAYRERGVTDVRLKVYPGARHELLNETIRNEVTADVITWITERLS
jgi:alpha-beta hydrolase superfamily lysophospholipase